LGISGDEKTVRQARRIFMNHRLLIALAALTTLLPLGELKAQTAVPRVVNFQAVLRDDSGNLISDGVIDLEFKILDQDGDEIYYEQQPGVQVVRSAVNVMIGEGIVPGSSPSAPTGGIPFNALDPATGSKFLQIKVGSNLPSDPMDLGSVPYAMYAQTALSLPSDFPESSIPGSFATDDEVAAAIAAHEAKDPAHPAAKISVVGPITHGGGTRVEKVVKDLDSALTTEEGTRASGDSSLQTQVNTANTNISNLQSQVSSNSSDISNLQATAANHETRITALESAPPAALAKAWVKFHSDSSHGATIDDKFNVSGVAFSGTDDGGWAVTFLTPFSSANYVMVGSAGGDHNTAMMISCDVATSTTSTAYVIGTDKNGNSQTGNARTYNLVFYGN
jgi:hypothetical protein